MLHFRLSFLAAVLGVYTTLQSVICDNEGGLVDLTDNNFELKTQATTGATSGDWFVKFYAPWCGHCKSMAKDWEKVADNLKNQINVARIDAIVNTQTAKRFKIKGFPTLYFFSNGLMYEYRGERTVEKLMDFAKGGYQMLTGKPIPEPTPWWKFAKDEIFGGIQFLQAFLFQSPVAFLMLFGVGLFSGSLMTCLILLMRKKSKCPGVSKSSKKKD